MGNCYDVIEYPNKEYLHSIFKYDNGILYRIKDGAKAGSMDKGYCKIQIGKKSYRRNRLVYIMHYGDIPHKKVIDHINGDSTDDRIENLNAITQGQNLQKKNKKPKSSSNFCGVHFCKKHNKWRATITVNKKQSHIGYFENEIDAAMAYNEKSLILYGNQPNSCFT